MSAPPLDCDALVVGAGITGLTAAVSLHAAGARVAVLEARDRVGGRVCSRLVGEAAVDLGATWFWPNEPMVRGLCDDLGVATFAQYLGGRALFEVAPGSAQVLDGNPIDAPSSRFTHGAQALAERLAHRLPEGTIRLGTRVQAIAVEGDAVRVQAPALELRAGHVVVALPPPLAVDRIAFTPPLPADLHAAAEATEVWMGTTLKAVAVYAQPFWRADDLAGAAISYAGPFREFHDHSGPGGDPAALFAFAPSAAFAGADEQAIALAFTQQLERLFGPAAATPLEVLVVDWSREGDTVPADVAPTASLSTYGAAVFQQPAHGRIHLAATETATAYAGHIEGAVRAGIAAAQRAAPGTPT